MTAILRAFLAALGPRGIGAALASVALALGVWAAWRRWRRTERERDEAFAAVARAARDRARARTEAEVVRTRLAFDTAKVAQGEKLAAYVNARQARWRAEDALKDVSPEAAEIVDKWLRATAPKGAL